jgi:hypothetical protein
MNNTLHFHELRIIAIAGAIVCAASFCHASSIAVPSSSVGTITAAMMNAQAGDTVLVGNGVYSEQVLIKSGVTLKARSPLKAIIKGNGKGCLVTLGGSSTLCGFELRSGAIGVSSKTADNAILFCRITSMTETGISCAGQLPKIMNNVIVFNKGSGIQGWDVRCTFSSINHNTIAYNSNNGIAMGGHSTVIIENNIVAFNERFGLKINEETVTAQLVKNVFFGNSTMSYIKLDGNFTGNPMFVDPKTLNFQLQAASQCKQKAADNLDIGALEDY